MVRKTVSLTNLLISFVLVTYLNINPSSGKPNRRSSLLCEDRTVHDRAWAMVLWGLLETLGPWSVCMHSIVTSHCMLLLTVPYNVTIERVDEWRRTYQFPSHFSILQLTHSTPNVIITVLLFWAHAKQSKITTNENTALFIFVGLV